MPTLEPVDNEEFEIKSPSSPGLENDVGDVWPVTVGVSLGVIIRLDDDLLVLAAPVEVDTDIEPAEVTVTNTVWIEGVDEVVTELSSVTVGSNPGNHATSFPAFTGRLAILVSIGASVNSTVLLSVLQRHPVACCTVVWEPAFLLGQPAHSSSCSLVSLETKHRTSPTH